MQIKGKIAVLAAALLMLAAPLAAEAQGSVLFGRVTDAEGNPLSGAEILLGSNEPSLTTGYDGTFRVPDMTFGLYYFGIRKMGYHPASDLLRFSEGDTLDITLTRIEATKKLDTVQVQARADAALDRELRRYDSAIQAARFGTVVTEADIATRRPTWTSDLFNAMNGFIVIGGGGSARVVGSRAQCLPSVFLDGQYTRGFNVNDIPPQFIKLLVAYRSAATVPPQFMDPRGNSSCGTIAVFTL